MVWSASRVRRRCRPPWRGCATPRPACRTAPCSCHSRWRSAASGTRRRRPAGRRPRPGSRWKSSPSKIADQLGEPVLHLLARAELVSSLKSASSMTPLQVVRLGQLADDLVDLVADLLVALEGDHVAEARALGHARSGSSPWFAGRLVRDVLHEQQRQDVVLVLARRPCCRAARRRTFPEGGVELGLLEGHWRPPVLADLRIPFLDQRLRDRF